MAAHCEHCVLLWGGGTGLCVSLQTRRSAIYRMALGSRRREGGAGGRRWTMDRAPIIGPQHKPKCKQGEEIFLFFFFLKATS